MNSNVPTYVETIYDASLYRLHNRYVRTYWIIFYRDRRVANRIKFHAT